jgi:primosomal protein N' (replication factor Y) (superfamily II helicase)
MDFETDLQTIFVQVVLPLPIKKLFTYRLPSEFHDLAMRGKRVFVPFGVRKVYTAIIYQITEEAPTHYEALNIISMIDDHPLISEQQLKFWEWVSEYYMCGLGDVMLAALPSGMRIASETFVKKVDDLDFNPEDIDIRENQILAILEGKEKVKISELETILKSKTSFVKVIKSLHDRGFIEIFEDLGQRYKPKSEAFIKISSLLKEDEIKLILDSLQRKSKNQFDVLLALLGQKDQTAHKKELSQKYLLKSAAIKALIDKNVIEQYYEASSRFNYAQYMDSKQMFDLTPIQAQAVAEIESIFSSQLTALLHGQTASGKTMVYIDLIKKQIALNKSVLLLVPEIALTDQLISQLESLFGDVMMVAHSRFSFNEKVEIWQNSQNGKVKLLVGVRSSIFVPMPNLGLIIIDEEHENTYKQSEKSPRYHARDCAIVLAKIANAKVLLGSATPSVESYYNAQQGKYGLVKLNERFVKAPAPKVTIVDLREDIRQKKMTGVFSEYLYTALKQLKDKKSQAIIFQNRKGFVPILECSECGWVSKCVNCDISLTYYKYSNNLRCHYCGFYQDNITKCKACGSHSMTMQGYGTEKITEELQLLIPELNISRFDQDSTRLKNAFKNIVQEFETQKIDVLVGTQIVVKGFDFKNVQLTAVVNADQIINFPDFRSHERAFQLLAQLAGRAGRGEHPGEMIVQTKQPEHPIIKTILNLDFNAMYQMQLTEREQFNYPPFSRLIKITFKHKNLEDVIKVSAQYAEIIKAELGNRVLGPEVPHVSRIKNLYIRNILIKFEPDHQKMPKLKSYLNQVYDYLVQQNNLKGVIFIPDVDCY